MALGICGRRFRRPFSFFRALALTALLTALAWPLGLSRPAFAQSSPSLQGSWIGYRTETGSLGSLPANSTETYVLYQASPGGNVVGTIAIYWPGTTYYWSGSASGTVSGSNLSLTFTPEVVNLPAGNTACGETETLPISSSGGVTTMVMPSYHPCGSGASTILSYTLTDLGWPHSGCSPCGSGPKTGLPIDPTTANVTDTETDYTTSGMNQLVFARTYNSFQPNLTYAVSMGTQWRTNYDRYLQMVSSSEVIAERPNGDQITFTLSGSTWSAGTDVDMTLTSSGSTWTLTGHDDSVETYTVSGSEGTLTSIAQRNGYTQSLTYNGSGQLTTVTDSYSRSLGLSYTGTLLTQVTTPDSLVLTYGYNGAGTLLTSVSYNTSPTTSQTYVYADASFPNYMTSITDEDGNTYKTFTYDTYGRATGNQMAGTSSALTMTYDDGNATRTETNPLGQEHTYYTAVVAGTNYKNITSLYRVANGQVLYGTSSYTYDSNGYVASVTDFNGNVTEYTNDSHGDPTQIVEAYGTAIARTTTIVYDATWVHLPDSITTPGVTKTFTYDGNGNPLTVTLTDTTSQTVPYSTNGQTRAWTYTYDATGHVLTVKTPNGNTTTFTYTGDVLTSATNALSQAVNVTSYTASGLPLTVVDANGVTTTFTYSTRNWQLTRDEDSTGGAYKTTSTYDAAGNETKLTQPDGSYIVTGYDASHRITSQTDSFGNSIHYTLNANGNPTATKYENPSSTVTRSLAYSYDTLNRLYSYEGGASQTSYTTYDGNSNLTHYTNAGSEQYIYTIDALNRVSKNTLPLASSAINYTYDAHNRPLTAEDANGNTTSYVYDGFGDLIQQASPDTGTAVFYYDSDGNLTKKVDALSVVTNFTYDALDRMLTRTYPADTAENVAYTYDQTGVGFAYGIGRLTSLTDAAGSLTRTYDTRGNLITETRTSGATVLATTYGYDAASRILTITYPDSSVVTYTRDAMGKVTGVSDTPSGGSATTIASSITYEPFGPANSITMGNGVTETITLDGDYRITQIVDNGSGSTHIQNISYTLNANDQPTQATDNLTSANSLINISYDALSRLEGFYNYKTSSTYSLPIDKNSNRTSYTGQATSYTLNTGTNQLASIVNGSTTTVSTNANGNITGFSPGFGSAAVTGLAYNNANQLSSVSSSTGTLGAYLYDALGDRFSKTVSSTTTMYQYSESGTLLAETTGGTEINYLYLNGKPIASLTGSTFTWLHDDNLGAPRVATNSAQAVQWKASYLPFGETNSTSGSATQNLRMPGQYYDAESGFSHNGARDYVPVLGRYLEADPIGIYETGESEGFNPYSYAIQNPLHVVDASGLCPTTECSFAGNGRGSQSWYVTYFTESGTRYGPYEAGPYPGPEPSACGQNQTETVVASYELASYNYDPAYAERCAKWRATVANLQASIERRRIDMLNNGVGQPALPWDATGDDQFPSRSINGHIRLMNIDKANLAKLNALIAAYCPPDGNDGGGGTGSAPVTVNPPTPAQVTGTAIFIGTLRIVWILAF